MQEFNKDFVLLIRHIIIYNRVMNNYIDAITNLIQNFQEVFNLDKNRQKVTNQVGCSMFKSIGFALM